MFIAHVLYNILITERKPLLGGKGAFCICIYNHICALKG